MPDNDALYMQRCFDLARLGAGPASPNPMVGAVLVYDGRIIGEGYYAHDGGPHAEVCAVADVKPADAHLVARSTLYVSLEPCNIHGRTPPCTDLILAQKIPRVVVAAGDMTPGVQGSGLERLRQAGVDVRTDVLADAGRQLSRYRNVFVSEHRPYVLLKYAQTRNGLMAPPDGLSAWLTNPYSRRWVHQWRATTDAILVGAGTARADNPALTTRYGAGRQPLRVVIDRHGALPRSLHLFDGQHPTWVFTARPGAAMAGVRYFLHDFESPTWLAALLHTLAAERVAHLTVEGGAWLLAQFVAQRTWDEARVFTTPHTWADGLPAPNLGIPPAQTWQLLGDELGVYVRPD